MTEVSIESTAAHAAEVDLLRRRVLNVVGHELRTPVAVLRGLADELVATTDLDAIPDLAAAIARNASRLDRLVDDLLLAAEITTVLPPGEAEAIRVRPLVEEALAACGLRAEVSGDAVATARPAAVSHLLRALADNAAGYGEGEASVLVSHDGESVMLEFASGGPELSDAEVRLASEAFFRGERAVTTRPGLGLGLAVARTLAGSEGGSLTVESRSGGGIVIRLRLPGGAA